LSTRYNEDLDPNQGPGFGCFVTLLFFVSMTSVFLLRVFFADRRRGRGRATGVARHEPRVIRTEEEAGDDG
jgi:hypothetical protein